MAVLNWTTSALADIDSIGEYYALSSPEYAKSVIAQFYHTVSRLERFPNLGRKVPELDLEHIRELLVNGYRIIYLVDDLSIDILAIVHGRQDLIRKLTGR